LELIYKFAIFVVIFVVNGASIFFLHRATKFPGPGLPTPAAIVNNRLRGQHNGSHRWGWVWHSNAGCLIGSAAAAVLPRAFPGGWLSPLPPRPMIVGDGRRRIKQSLHQIWLFLAVAALLCFLLS
jgi:hypothetical protein